MYETALVPAGYSHHAPLLNKWLRKLMMIRFTGLLLTILAVFPFLLNVTNWLSLLMTACTIAALFYLAAANIRYRKVAIFQCISLGGALITAFTGAAALGGLFSICSIIAQYQEYHAHAEICTDKSPALSSRWTSLFWWQMGVGLVSGFVLSSTVVIGVLAGADADGLVTVITVLITAVSVILELICLKTLKKTAELFS